MICYLDWKVAVTKDVMFVITSRFLKKHFKPDTVAVPCKTFALLWQ